MAVTLEFVEASRDWLNLDAVEKGSGQVNDLRSAPRGDGPLKLTALVDRSDMCITFAVLLFPSG